MSSPHEEVFVCLRSLRRDVFFVCLLVGGELVHLAQWQLLLIEMLSFIFKFGWIYRVGSVEATMFIEHFGHLPLPTRTHCRV